MTAPSRRTRIASFAAVALVVTAGAAVSIAAPPSPYTRPGATELASRASNGTQGNNPSNISALSADGRYLAFASQANNLVPGDTNVCGKIQLTSGGATVTIDCWDVFVRDRKTGRTSRVSVASDGSQAISAPGGGGSGKDIAISDDGRYVAFISDAINLVPGDTNHADDVFVHDTRTRQTRRVSVSSTGAEANGGAGGTISMSSDGRTVVFDDTASNLVAGDTNNTADVFARDLVTRKTVRLSVGSNRVQGDDASVYPSISANGRYVAFTSYASNLVPGGSVAQQKCQCHAGDVYRHDLRTHQTILVSVATGGTPAAFVGFPRCEISVPGLPVEPPTLPSPAGETVWQLTHQTVQLCSTYSKLAGSGKTISADGRYIAFTSNATNLVPNDGNYGPVVITPSSPGFDVFVHDVVTNRTERVSVDSVGHEKPRGNSWGRFASGLHADPSMLMYQSWPADDSAPCPEPVRTLGLPGNTQVPICGSERSEAFAYDTLSGSMDWLSASASGRPANPGTGQPVTVGTGTKFAWAYPQSMSQDGRYVSFWSSYTDLAPGDRNNSLDVFVRDRGSRTSSGGMTGNGKVAMPSSALFTSTGSVRATDRTSEVTSVLSERGADLLAARLTYRPVTGDLFLRLDMTQLPAATGVIAPGLLHGWRFTADSVNYEVRAQRVLGADYDRLGGASFGLFRQTTAGLWTKVAGLNGGYGTIGDSVVTAVPLTLLGGEPQLADVTVYTAIGNYLSGPTKVLDSLRLSR